MRVMMSVWVCALTAAYLVAGRSIEQALLSGKILLIGFTLGFFGAGLARALHAYRDAKNVIYQHHQ